MVLKMPWDNFLLKEMSGYTSINCLTSDDFPRRQEVFQGFVIQKLKLTNGSWAQDSNLSFLQCIGHRGVEDRRLPAKARICVLLVVNKPKRWLLCQEPCCRHTLRCLPSYERSTGISVLGLWVLWLYTRAHAIIAYRILVHNCPGSTGLAKNLVNSLSKVNVTVSFLIFLLPSAT